MATDISPELITIITIITIIIIIITDYQLPLNIDYKHPDAWQISYQRFLTEMMITLFPQIDKYTYSCKGMKRESPGGL